MDEEAVVEDCRRGDLAAYRKLYERFEQPFLRTALRVLGRPQDAEDAVQDSFLRLHRGIHNYRKGSRFSTYFFKILLNSCTDILRKRGQEASVDMDSLNPGFDSRHELRLSIEEAVAALPERMRACFVLSAVEELSMEEVAKILDISVGAVKASLHRARARLRDWLRASRGEVAP